jgi:hypothetical protein
MDSKSRISREPATYSPGGVAEFRAYKSPTAKATCAPRGRSRTG